MTLSFFNCDPFNFLNPDKLIKEQLKLSITRTTSLKIDRTKYGVRYGSGSFFDNLGDNTISDNFELDVTLKF